MAAPQMEMKEQNVQGEFTTAEVTHLVKSVDLEATCYLRNHVLMRLSGTEGPIRQWHDNVTRPNLDRLVGVVGEMGLPVPFVKPIEERENEIKAKLQTGNVEGTLTEGEVIRNIVIDAEHLNVWYATSIGLATHTKVLDVFRRNQQTILDQKPRLEEAFKKTKEYVAPPMVQKVKLVGAMTKGIPATQARGGGGGGVTRGT